MRILYVCHRFPFPPKRGGKIRPFNMISHLSKNHQVDVVSISRSKEEEEEGKGISEYCNSYTSCKISNILAWSKALLFGATFLPASFGYFHSFKMKKSIKKLLTDNHYDLIFVHCSSVAHYVSWVKDVPKILDFGDMDSQKWLEYSKFKSFPFSLIYKIEGIKLEHEEKRLATKFNFSSCTTRAEHETLVSYQATDNTFWFPNGVDAEYFHTQTGYVENQICFIGRMDYYPNQEGMFWFCEHVWPKILASDADLKLVIVGANPSEKVRELEKLTNVTVTGLVPDVRPYVLDSALTVAPLRIARGTQNKILESMAMGIPVICSQQAAGGIDAVEDEHVLVARDADQYVEAVLKLTGNKEYRRQLGAYARQRVLTHHNWESSMKRMDDLLQRCLNNEKLNKEDSISMSIQD